MLMFEQIMDESWGEKRFPHQQDSRYQPSQQLQHSRRRCRRVISASTRSGGTQGPAQKPPVLPLGLPSSYWATPRGPHAAIAAQRWEPVLPAAAPLTPLPRAAPLLAAHPHASLSQHLGNAQDENVLITRALVWPNHCTDRLHVLVCPKGVRSSTLSTLLEPTTQLPHQAPKRNQDLTLQQIAGSTAEPGPAWTTVAPGTPRQRALLLKLRNGGRQKPVPLPLQAALTN